VTKTRSRKYDSNALYYRKNKQTYAYFNNGFLYFPTPEDKNSFLRFAKIVEGRMNLGIFSVGAASIDRWPAHKTHHSFTFDLKKITYEKI
jgi:hypothetical protein